MPLIRLPLSLPCLVTMLALGLPLQALASKGAVCENRPKPPTSLPLPPVARTDVEKTLQVTADRIESIKGETIIFSGKVIATHDKQRIYADRAVYRKQDNTLDATGNVRLEMASGDSYQTPSAHVRLDTRSGFTGKTRFFIVENNSRGRAARMEFEGEDHIRLTKVHFTTCPKQQEDWLLSVSELRLDRLDDSGVARNATLRFKGVPLFYTPFFSFPLGNKRKSGFLVPAYGISDKLGSDITVPYYWNLAPNYDTTLTPRLMTRRGMQLQTEFRYLGPTHQGQAEMEVLSRDQVTGEFRAGASYRHRHTFSPQLTAEVDFDWVSDPGYFDDFGASLDATSQTHLSQKLQAAYINRNWKLAALASGFQTISGDPPYARLPQLTADFTPPERRNHLSYDFSAAVTDFRHDTKETGKRLNLTPGVSFPLRRDYGYLFPRLGLYHTGYFDRSVGSNDSITTGIFSLDSGLFFDRSLKWSGRRLTQTLEPRLYYVYSPYRDQDSLPNFDTSVPDLTFISLFQENRFVGGDRIGDANQLTLALTSRLLDDETGIEKLTASIGQIHYFSDRRVTHTLPPDPVDTSQNSDIVGEVTAWLSQNWYLRSAIQWDTVRRTTEKDNFYLQYQPAGDKILNLGYRYQVGRQELVDISTQWPLGKRWTLLARSQYSLESNYNQDTYAGFIYTTCCWSLRTIAGRRRDQSGAQVNSISFELVFQGLGGVKTGAPAAMPLDQSVFNK